MSVLPIIISSIFWSIIKRFCFFLAKSIFLIIIYLFVLMYGVLSLSPDYLYLVFEGRSKTRKNRGLLSSIFYFVNHFLLNSSSFSGCLWLIKKFYFCIQHTPIVFYLFSSTSFWRKNKYNYSLMKKNPKKLAK